MRICFQWLSMIKLDMILLHIIRDLQNWFQTNTKQSFAVSFYCLSCREYLRRTNRDKKVYSCISYFLWIRIVCRPKALIYWIGVANNCNRERYVYTYILILVEQFVKHAKNFDGKKHAKPIVETIYHMMYTKVKIFINRLHKRTNEFTKKVQFIQC